MQLNLEPNDKNSIEAYSATEIKINDQLYTANVLITPQAIITNWPVTSISNLDEAALSAILADNPEIILIGHHQLSKQATPNLRHFLATRRVALEAMDLGAACRTYNVLVSEYRRVALGILF